jgi:Catalase
MAEETKSKVMTTDAGRLVGDNQNSLTVGDRGPIVFEDFLLFEKMAHFNRACSGARRPRQRFWRLRYSVRVGHGKVHVIELAARNAAGSMIAEIYLAAASSLTGMPRALAMPSP